jgi:hypothetical protein
MVTYIWLSPRVGVRVLPPREIGRDAVPLEVEGADEAVHPPLQRVDTPGGKLVEGVAHTGRLGAANDAAALWGGREKEAHTAVQHRMSEDKCMGG